MRQNKATTTQLKCFNVLVMATMSAGKTSLINALIGKQLLHVANEATTTCHAQIQNEGRTRFFTGIAYGAVNDDCSNSLQLLEKKNNIQSKQLEEWNASEQVKKIELAGSFRTQPTPMHGLILHDTPGPNNSKTVHHANMAFTTLKNQQFNTLIYVLNATQLGINDDHDLLSKLLHETATNKKPDAFCFVLNKVDLLDEEKGESVRAYVNQAREYLRQIGFIDPVVIPCTASIALYAKKALNKDLLTRRQNLNLEQALLMFKHDKRILIQASHAPDIVKNSAMTRLKSLENANRRLVNQGRETYANELKQLIAYSGVETVLAFLQHQRTFRTSA